MTEEEARNLAVSEAWERLYNEDVARMCDECYAPDCTVTIMASGRSVRGRETLKAGELAILKAAPDRRLTAFNRLAQGNQVLVEVRWTGTHTGDGWGGPPTGRSFDVTCCAVQVFEDGMVVSERAYGESIVQLQLGRPQV